MKELVIRPNEGVDQITFGMTQEEVRQTLGEGKPIEKSSDTSVASDYFPDRSVIVHYDGNGKVEAIEVGSLATAVFMSRSLIGEPFAEIAEWLRTLDPRIETDDAGLTSFRFGIGLYAPHAGKSPDDPVEGVIAFRPGYYG